VHIIVITSYENFSVEGDKGQGRNNGVADLLIKNHANKLFTQNKPELLSKS
jgi:hypothetical protein